MLIFISLNNKFKNQEKTNLFYRKKNSNFVQEKDLIERFIK